MQNKQKWIVLALVSSLFLLAKFLALPQSELDNPLVSSNRSTPNNGTKPAPTSYVIERLNWKITWAVINRRHSQGVKKGGYFEPGSNGNGEKVAIIVSFRDREAHLKQFVNHMVPILKEQKVEFQIFVVEMQNKGAFAKGSLYNAGFKLALKRHNFDCFIFHDVDLLLERRNLSYSCDDRHPKHMSVEIDIFSYELPYYRLVGGVLAVPRETYQDLNGYSNAYTGWGGEDDDFYARIQNSDKNLTLLRPPSGMGRYAAIPHNHSQVNNLRFNLLFESYLRWSDDGLRQVQFTVKKIRQKPLFTHISVTIPPVDKLIKDIEWNTHQRHLKKFIQLMWEKPIEISRQFAERHRNAYDDQKVVLHYFVLLEIGLVAGMLAFLCNRIRRGMVLRRRRFGK